MTTVWILILKNYFTGQNDKEYYGIWNLWFTYEVYLTVNNPLSFSENYMYKYNIFVYVFGTIFSIAIFYIKKDFFTDSSIYVWYIQSGIIYDLYVNVPIILCFAIILYVLVKYTGASRYRGYSKNRFRIDQILNLQRLYFTFWSFFNFSNMGVDIMVFTSPYLPLVRSLCMSLKPLGICIVFSIAICYAIKQDSYKLIDLDEEEMKEMSKEQNLLDKVMLIQSQKNPDDKEGTAADQAKRNLDQTENLKDVLRREVLEYILKGFEKVFKNIKENQMIEDNESDDPSTTNERPPLLKRILFFCLKRTVHLQIIDNEEDEKPLDGHPDVIKKVSPLTLSQIERDAFFEKSHFVKRNLTYANRSAGNQTCFEDEYEFVELSPKLFRNIRRIHNIDDRMVRSIFSLINIDDIDISISAGKGGSFFIKSLQGGRMLIKSITIPEYEIIQRFLIDYYKYLLLNPNTYLCPVLGVYKLKLQQSSQVPPITFLMMRNVLNIDTKDLSEEDLIYLFDLKGSVHGRRTLDNPADILDYEKNYRTHKNMIFRDIDFFQSFRKLNITLIQSERIMSQISEDWKFLAKQNFMDYSLLLYIIIKPYKDFLTNPQNYEENGVQVINENSKPKITKATKKKKIVRNTISVHKPHSMLKKRKGTDQSLPEEEHKELTAVSRKLSDGIIRHIEHKFSQDNAQSDNGKNSANDDNQVLVFSERNNNKLKIYHICNSNDVNNMLSQNQNDKFIIADTQDSN